jgi:hypothetical protein
MVAGEWRVKNGAIENLDLDELLLKHRESAFMLAKRYYES